MRTLMVVEMNGVVRLRLHEVIHVSTLCYQGDQRLKPRNQISDELPWTRLEQKNHAQTIRNHQFLTAIMSQINEQN